MSFYKKPHISRTARISSLALGLGFIANGSGQEFQDSGPAEPAATPRPIRSIPEFIPASTDDDGTSVFAHEEAAKFWGFNPFESLLQNPFQWGPFQLRPFGSYRYTYGNGISGRRSDDENTSLHQISPGAILVSRHLSFRYSPTLNYYSNDAFEDGVSHTASANARFGVDDWFFSLSHSYERSLSPLVETRAQTDRQSHTTALSAHFEYSDRTSFAFILSQNIEETQSFNEYTTWSSMNWAHYKWTDTVLIGVGAGGGYTVQDFGSDMTFQQLQGRIAWNPTEKLGFSLNGGMEFRQFVDSEFDAQVNPIGGASVSYTPWEPTTFSLSARHSVGSSVVRAQTTKRSTVSAGVRQRFLERFHVSLYGSYRHKEYTGLQTATVISEEATRSDDSVSFSANLGFRVFTKGDVSIFYQGSRNDSSFDNFTFTSNQYGAQISYHF